MRISTVVLGKAVSNAEISGHHVITKLMRNIQSIGQNIERWERDKVQIPGTKIALERAILDTLGQRRLSAVLRGVGQRGLHLVAERRQGFQIRGVGK